MLESGIPVIMLPASIEVTPSKVLSGSLRKGLFPPRTRVFTPFLPNSKPDKLVQSVKALWEMGYQPVPHIVAHKFENISQVHALLGQLRAATADELDDVFVIGGQHSDQDQSWAFPTALDLLDTGVFQQNNISKIGVGAYPQGIVGHVFGGDRLSTDSLDEALRLKADWAKREGVQMYGVTQFCLDTADLLDWVQSLQQKGISIPLHIGFAGCCDVNTLRRFVKLCDVPAPPSVDVDLEGKYTPMVQLQSIVAHPAVVGVHFFPFGGISDLADMMSSNASIAGSRLARL